MSIGGPPNSTLDRAVIKSAAGGIRHAIAAGNQASRGLSDVAPAHRAAPRHHDRRRDSPDDSEWIQSSFGRCVDIWRPAVDILPTERVAEPRRAPARRSLRHTWPALWLCICPRIRPRHRVMVENHLNADAVFTGMLTKDLTPVRLVYAGKY